MSGLNLTDEMKWCSYTAGVAATDDPQCRLQLMGFFYSFHNVVFLLVVYVNAAWWLRNITLLSSDFSPLSITILTYEFLHPFRSYNIALDLISICSFSLHYGKLWKLWCPILERYPYGVELNFAGDRNMNILCRARRRQSILHSAFKPCVL